MHLPREEQNAPEEAFDRKGENGRASADAFPGASQTPMPSCTTCASQSVSETPSTVCLQLHARHLHQLLLAIEQMSQSFVMFDADQRLVVCNKAFCDLYVLPPELCRPGVCFIDILEHAGRIDFKPIDTTISARIAQTELLMIKDRWNGLLEMCDGRIISTIHEPLPDGGWISIQDDVTKAQAQHKQLETQAMRFRAAVNNMSHGLSMFDADKRLVTCNETFMRLYQLPEELTRPGTRFVDIYEHRYRIGMTARERDLETGQKTILELVETKSAWKGPVSTSTGKVVMLNHQPLADGGWLSIHEDITEQHRNAEIIRHMARHDSLTGLANRATFLEAMNEAEPRMESGELMAVLCIDLDRFKEINDSLGHVVGDAVLTSIAGRLLSVLDDRGITARLGGDEFAVLISPLASEAEAEDIAEALLAIIAAPLTVGNTRVSCKASCGIALAPQHGYNANALMRCADLALYRAKIDSSGNHRVFEPNMDVVQRRRQHIEQGLNRAIETNSLSLMFQPLIALEDGRVACCEALMRWQSPELGQVSPTEFIPVAEETRVIREIGVWALETACLEAVNWPHHIRVAVNVSPIQFRGNSLVDEVRHALAVSGLEPSRLELEITESLFLADDAHNLKVLHQLRELGVRFALDDFGTGYSSLAYLLRFPFDKIKIDRSIVSTITEKPETMAMITAIVDLCRGFNMLTVAEGIETEEQLAEIKSHGCDEVQGYVFSPPLPQSAIGELLRRRHRVSPDEAILLPTTLRA